LKMTERMYRSTVEAAPGIYPNVESWLARYTGDPKLGAEALALPDLPAEDRMDLLALRETAGAATAEATLAELTRIAANERWRWATQKRLIDYLMEKKQFDEAERVASEWLKPNASAPGLDPIFAKIAIAKSLRALGRNDEALRAVGPAAGSWQGGAMYQTAVLLSMSGDKARAKELMLARLERYPVPESLAGVAELHWRLGDYPAAAQALASTTIPMRLVDWRDSIGSAFAEVFVRSKVPGSISAFEAMKRAHISPMNLMQMAQGAHYAGDDRITLDLLTRIDDPKVQVAAAFRALPIMKRLDGDATATAWATSKLRAGPALTVASLCVADDCDDAIWLLEEPPPGENRDLFWLFRAVVVARHHDSPHRDEVLKYFQANGTARYFVMGRAVMALEDESAITGFAGDIHQVCEVAFYLGAAAEGQGRIEDASDWYRAALETNLIRENEYHFAYNRLAAWRSQGKSLGRIAADAH
jgi:tetratricopeptide (TPR) repeat protein